MTSSLHTLIQFKPKFQSITSVWIVLFIKVLANIITTKNLKPNTSIIQS